MFPGPIPLERVDIAERAAPSGQDTIDLPTVFRIEFDGRELQVRGQMRRVGRSHDCRGDRRTIEDEAYGDAGYIGSMLRYNRMEDFQ